MVKMLPKKYELLLKLENENPRWFMEIADDDERLIELRKAWQRETKSTCKNEYEYTDENLIRLIRHGYAVSEMVEMLKTTEYAVRNRMWQHKNVKIAWGLAVKARKTLAIRKNNEIRFVIGGLKAAGKKLKMRPEKVKNMMAISNPDYDVSWYFECYDTVDELEEYLNENKS
jgi:ATP-dependent 26S proteasome regulatory subunit